MTDDEDVMRNVQREKKLNLDLAFFDFHKIISYGTISKGNQWKINGNQRKYWKLVKIKKYQIEVKLFLSLHVSHHIFIINHSFLMFLDGKKFENGAVCGTGLADSVSEHVYVPEVIQKWSKKIPK